MIDTIQWWLPTALILISLKTRWNNWVDRLIGSVILSSGVMWLTFNLVKMGVLQ